MTTVQPSSGGQSTTRTPRAQKRSEIVARAIIDDMVGREPGEPIGGEQQLLERYGVARNTLREALRLLEVFGLITIKPGSGGGPIVMPVGPRDFGNVATLYFRLNGYTFEDLLIARCSVETSLVRTIASSPGCVEIADLLHEVEDRADSPDSSGGPEAWMHLHGAWHRTLLERSEVRILGLFGAALQEIHADWGKSWNLPPRDRATVINDHRRIADAIKKGDAKRAGDLMYSHLSEGFDRGATQFPGLLSRIVDWHS